MIIFIAPYLSIKKEYYINKGDVIFLKYHRNNMYDKLLEFLNLFIEDSSADYWYDNAVVEAMEMLELFSENDWLCMMKDIRSQPVEIRKKIAYCFDDENNLYQLELLLLLLESADDELFEVCIDSLRIFLPAQKDMIQQKIAASNELKNKLRDAKGITKKIFDDFLFLLDKK